DRAQISPLPGKFLVSDDPCFELLLADLLTRFLAISGKRPVAPDSHALVEQWADIGVAGQKPKHLAQGCLPEDPLGSQERDAASGDIESQLRAAQRPRAYTRAINPLVALRPDSPHQG